MRKAIAIDFDGCLCTNEYPAIGKPNWAVINRAKVEQRAGAGLILWTCREGQLLQEAVEACRGWGLTFDALNETLPDWIEEFGTQPRKVGASEYWDDKAARIPVADRFFVGGPGDDSIEFVEPTTDGDDVLLPCPFCGSTHVIYERYRHDAGERWRCWCADCCAGIDPGTAQEMGQVRDMWNRRAMPSNSPLTLKELEGMVGKPLYVIPAEKNPDWKPCWVICMEDYILVHSNTSESRVYFLRRNEDYGKTWLAYRHNPENGKY